jgi:benzoate transport
MTLRERIEFSRMSPYQWLIVGLCVWLNALDGFDVLAMSFTANRVTTEFGLSGAQLGLLFSVALFGMAAGSLFLAPFADVIGRRPLLLASAGLASAGMLLASSAQSYAILSAFRFVTGLGVGAVLACVTVIVAEYSNLKYRGLAIGIYSAGYGLGATLGGLAAVGLIADHGWRSVFLVGGLVAVASVVAVWFLVPESVDFLLHKRPVGVVDQLNRIAQRIAQAPVASLDEETARLPREAPSKNKVGALLTPAYRRTTLLLWAAFFLIMCGFYFVNSWTPRLLTSGGMTENQGITMGLLISLGGAAGSVLYGVVAAKVNARKVLVGFAVLAAVSMAVFIPTTAFLGLAMVLAVVVGMLINGCVAGMYTLTPPRYPVAIRGTAMGWGIGIGRIGAILAPTIAGFLVDNKWSAGALYLAAAAVVLVAAVAAFLLRDVAATGAAPRAAVH